MKRALARILALCVAGVVYWQIAGMLTGVSEPWDARSYWTIAYPLSLILSAATGPLFSRHGWIAGAALTMAQLPVMWLNAGTGPLWLAGLMILCLLAIPAMGVSWLASRIVRRSREA